MFDKIASFSKLLRPLYNLHFLRQLCSSSALRSISSSSVSVDGRNITYWQAGTGPYTALCLPGALGTGNGDFGHQLSGLAGPEVTLVAWDPPGYGKSRPPDRSYTTDFLNKDALLAANMMKALGHEKYGVLGWSDGGITGIILAANQPSQVDRLVVWGANAFLTQQDIDIYQGLRDVSAWSARMRAPMEALYGVQGFKMIWHAWVDVLTIIHAKGGDLCKTELAKVVCPSLVIHGSKDAMVPNHHSEYLHKHLINSRLKYFEDGKHNLHMKYADPFNELVKGFLLET